ncbi:hypothetical protein DXG01_004812 [Tephrocybe rancida]|nr:hypothetical protein DXG01_004812 [Tephrocybe rancida]
MASLSDQIDRLSRNTRGIKTTTAQAATNVDGLFTRAVLSASLGDLIRDVDPSELGLFSLPESEITRAEFTGATPLKKAPSRREDVQKQKDFEPEVYAQAALKQNIQTLTETLQQAQSVEGAPLKSLIDEEEERVQTFRTRLAALRERKMNTSTSKNIRKASTIPRRPLKAEAPPPPSSPQEDNFWNTPATATRTLRFTDNLIEPDSLFDEQADLGDISTDSFTSPMPTSRIARLSSLISPNDSLSPDPVRDANEEGEDGYGAEGSEDDKTVVLRKPIPEPQTPQPSPPHTTPEAPATPAPDTPGLKPTKVRVNNEIERIAARIWTTVGDTIMPGHVFDISQGGAGNKPPRAKETIAHLQSLSALSPSPTSPSVSSVSSASATGPAPATSQQILTAHMLLALLASPPQFSLPLNKVKDLLAAKASTGGGAVATGTTRILYGCVAKRLVKIDRSGGEQVVKFDA